MTNSFARAPLRDSDLIAPRSGLSMVLFKSSPGESNVHSGFSTHRSLLLQEVHRLKSQKPKVQVLNSKINTWAMLCVHFLSFIFIPANSFIKQRIFHLRPICRFLGIPELLLITSFFVLMQRFWRVHHIFTKIHDLKWLRSTVKDVMSSKTGSGIKVTEHCAVAKYFSSPLTSS